MVHVRTLFQSLPWHELYPSYIPGKIMRGMTMPPDEEAFDDSLLPTCAVSDDGKLSVTYVPIPQKVYCIMDYRAKPVRARWCDPTNGQFTPIAVPTPRAGKPRVTSGLNAAGEGDMVLVVEAE